MPNITPAILPVIHRVRVPARVQPVEVIDLPKGSTILSAAPARGWEDSAFDLWYSTTPGVDEKERWGIIIVPTGCPVPPIGKFLTTLVLTNGEVSHLFVVDPQRARISA